MDAFSFIVGLWIGIALYAVTIITGEWRYRRERRNAIPDDLRDAFYGDEQ